MFCENGIVAQTSISMPTEIEFTTSCKPHKLRKRKTLVFERCDIRQCFSDLVVVPLTHQCLKPFFFLIIIIINFITRLAIEIVSVLIVL